ncbi:MAG: hypothetical protein ACR2N2_11335 [Acidimicrobiia bacterium]
MKRWLVLAMTMVLAFSMSAAAIAGDHVDDESAEAEQGELNDKQTMRAASLAGYFAPHLDDVEEAFLYEQITMLRTTEPKVGWGAMYKLLRLSEYTGQDLDVLIEELRADGGWGFGKAMKEMRTDADWKESSGTAKNFGQFKKQQREKNSDG